MSRGLHAEVMKAEELKQITEFAGEARDVLLDLLSPTLNERLIDQPVEAVATYLANLRWAMYTAIEALGKLERMSETMMPLWPEKKEKAVPVGWVAGIDAGRFELSRCENITLYGNASNGGRECDLCKGSGYYAPLDGDDSDAGCGPPPVCHVCNGSGWQLTNSTTSIVDPFDPSIHHTNG